MRTATRTKIDALMRKLTDLIEHLDSEPYNERSADLLEELKIIQDRLDDVFISYGTGRVNHPRRP